MYTILGISVIYYIIKYSYIIVLDYINHFMYIYILLMSLIMPNIIRVIINYLYYTSIIYYYHIVIDMLY